ncbi:MAG: hypothetical protein A2W68_08160 [Betaproteobacteria bacterium RIFCSPLOWO2_02_64_14]|nr:MAG: hypothetical protein A2W68_08160 [Betaproteobacteria bacterium RIFCSPLOWO2_02_64_14]
MEDTGLPLLLRDAQVLPIWEGTTNVLSLDVVRVAGSNDAWAALKRETGFILQGLREPALVRNSARVEQTLEQAESWLRQAEAGDLLLEAGARRFALTLGRTMSLALLARHAQWSLDEEQDARALAAARRFATHGINLLADMNADDARMLARDEPG